MTLSASDLDLGELEYAYKHKSFQLFSHQLNMQKLIRG
jgi:hypothetical protein